MQQDGATDKSKQEEKKLRPCCACPETKKVRDEWWVIEITFNLLY